MSTATMEKKATTKSTKVREHTPERKAKLRRARMSESVELTQAQCDLLDSLPTNASEAQIEAVVKGKKSGGGDKKKAAATKYPEDVRAAYLRALELTGTPDKGGPKYPLTVKQTDAVKKALASKAKGTADANAALAKHAGDAALRKIAKGQDASKEAVVAVREFLKAHPALKDDRTMYARKGAAIVLALREGE